MSEKIIGVFSSFDQSHQAIAELERLGIGEDRVGFVTGDPALGKVFTGDATGEVTSGVEAGVVAGGATGFLLGMTAFAVAVTNPIVAAGTIAATLAGGGIGAVAGGLIGVFKEHGFTAHHSERAAKHVTDGGTIITVSADPQDAVLVRGVIEQYGGATKVDDIPDAGTIPSDPLHFSADTFSTQTDDNPISELGASRQSRA